MTTISGPFDVKMTPHAPFDTRDGVTIGRASFDKRFHGPLDATSVVQMMSVRTPVETSGVYVAVERIEGTLAGRRGAFVVTHLGTAQGGQQSLTVQIVPDSGTGELAGISGSMQIRIENGAHFYDFTYELAASAK
jgi:hypothetical protein